jgi:hypothetical protein
MVSSKIAFAAAILVMLVLCGGASAGTFHVGIAEPGVGPISAATVSELGMSVERRTVEYHGEASFGGTMTFTPGLRAIAAVWGQAENAPRTDEERLRYCGFVRSLLERYPQISDIVIWNEPNLAFFWGQGAEAYAELVQTCSPRIRTAGARVLAPGMSPSTVAGVTDFARHIAALGPHLIDEWVQHDYYADGPTNNLANKVAAVRAEFGWNVPMLIGESGEAWGPSLSYLMTKAYCAGATGWLNFKLRDDGDWRPTGLEDVNGNRKPAWEEFRRTATLIHSGRYACLPAPPPPLTQVPHSNSQSSIRLPPETSSSSTIGSLSLTPFARAIRAIVSR